MPQQPKVLLVLNGYSLGAKISRRTCLARVEKCNITSERSNEVILKKNVLFNTRNYRVYE